MNELILLADAAAEDGTLRLVLEYLLYAAVIVVGILILLLLRRKTRLPRHSELRAQLNTLAAELSALRKADLPRLKWLKALSRLLYRTDKLIYVTDRMADKERDGEIANVSVLLEQMRAELAVYRSGARTSDDDAGFTSAQKKIAEAEELIQRVLARDAQLRTERSR